MKTQLLKELESIVGNNGSGDLEILVDIADEELDTIEDLVSIIIESREEEKGVN